MSRNFDERETRDQAEREAEWATVLPALIAAAKSTPGRAGALADIDPAKIVSREDLATLPVLRKSALVEAQSSAPPLGGIAPLAADGFAHLFQSPGPIYEPGQRRRDYWRLGRFLAAAGVGAGDIVQNCFSYHMTPAGLMFENAAEAVGATVFPAGTGQTEQQAAAAAHLGVTAYAGTPDYLKVILEKGDELGLDLSRIKVATVSGGPLFPSLRAWYEARGVRCIQAYATADVGNIAYETPAMEGMVVDEGAIVEIVTPGTGNPVPDGEVGEVVVTVNNPDYPLIRFATGDLSAVLAGESPCGRTNMRIKGWMGRADQTVKVKGMFVRPEQVAAIVAKHPGLGRARLVVGRADEQDTLHLRVEGEGFAADELADTLRSETKLKGDVSLEPPGTLPADGIVIEDTRSFD